MPDLKLEKAEKKEITGHEIVSVLQSFDAVFRQVVEGHQNGIAAASRHADQLLTDLETGTELTKLAALLSKEVPTWSGHDGKTLKDLLSLGDQLEIPAIDDRAGKERRPNRPRRRKRSDRDRREGRPPGPEAACEIPSVHLRNLALAVRRPETGAIVMIMPWSAPARRSRHREVPVISRQRGTSAEGRTRTATE
ncbi:hypothetical protein ACFQ73_01745 [Amycolatopsis japonica]|uniref:hypothetical protein n=1 Tax=Amycolatopsis japonica TaxID=208439 RepID=UPI00366B2BBC